MLNIFKQLTEQLLAPNQLIRRRYVTFKGLLNSDRQCHHLLAEIEKIHYSGQPVDISRLRILFNDFSASVEAMIDSLHDLAPGQYKNLTDYYKKIDFYGRFALAPPETDSSPPFLLPLTGNYHDDHLVGGKGLHLSLLKGELDLPVPEGFILSTSTWNQVVRSNNLRGVIDRELAEVDTSSVTSLQAASERLIDVISQAALPDRLLEAINRNAKQITTETGNQLFAVRSSAVAEDSDLSFAGQYLSLLNVTAEEIGPAYLQVLASKYTPEAMLYRILNGFDDEATPMAVLVLAMVKAASSGVAVTSNGEGENSLHIRVHSVTGLGDKLMAGEVIPEVTEIDIIDSTPAIHHQADPGDNRPGEAQLLELAEYAQKIDSHYRHPQEIEWSCDENGSLYLLQSRRLNKPLTEQPAHSVPDLSSLPLLFQGGETGGYGVGCGKLYHLPRTSQLPEIPDGSILVSEITPPSLVSVLPHLNGVIARSGSAADHFSSVAREFGIPVLLQVGDKVEKLEPGMEVTLHADRREVYRGQIDLPENLQVKKQLSPESSIGRILKMVIDFTSPLTLLDPTAETFRPESCRSLHDIIRFVHEKGVQAMFLHNPDSFFRKPKTVHLISDIPLQVYLIDVGGGLADNRENPLQANARDILSTPFKALWQGLSHPNVNWRDRDHFDWASYDSIALAGGIASKNDSALASYCLLSREYLNINMRFGYHFTLLDCFCGETPEENYILMRFAGGGGTDIGKDLRLTFITTILERLNFTCEQAGEMLDARLMRYDSERTASMMEQLGHLLGSVRLLDMALRSEEEVLLMVERFFGGTYDFSHE